MGEITMDIGRCHLTKESLSRVQQLREKDIRRVHRIQRGLTGGLLGSLLPVRRLLPIVVLLLSRTSLFRRFQRQLMALPEPLPVNQFTTQARQ